jgi:hypothetical protein
MGRGGLYLRHLIFMQCSSGFLHTLEGSVELFLGTFERQDHLHIGDGRWEDLDPKEQELFC